MQSIILSGFILHQSGASGGDITCSHSKLFSDDILVFKRCRFVGVGIYILAGEPDAYRCLTEQINVQET